MDPITVNVTVVRVISVEHYDI